MEQQRAQTHFLFGNVSRVGAVKSTAKPNDAVEIPSISTLTNVGCQPVEGDFPLRARMPIGFDQCAKIIAIVTPATLVKTDVWVRGVHDAMTANLMNN
jgi:hypothetical protein